MKWQITITLLCLIFLTACNPKEFWNDVKNLQFRKPYEINTPTENNFVNQTNETINQTETTEDTILSYDEDYANIFLTNVNSILFMEEDKNYIIDSPKENPKLINYIERFEIEESEFIVSTIDKEEHNGGIQYIVIKAPPKILYDNGIENEYREKYITLLDRYNSYWNRTPTSYVSVLNDFKYDNFEFFVPYSKGLSTIKEENSIVVYYNKKFLYMSDCYGNCESKIPPIKTEFLVLANGGKCPTNSFDFILNTGAKYVIGDEICSDLIEDLNMIGINHISLKEKGVMQIIFKEEEIEINYEGD
ncbi:MAG: hypothetical protein KKB31_06090 [Nanoarchaeota archaeon]|nr:hypothetical protein [Nanoarchaeota archaeon]